MAAPNKQVVLRRLVVGKPSLDDLELVAGPLPEPQAGEVLARTIFCHSIPTCAASWVRPRRSAR